MNPGGDTVTFVVKSPGTRDDYGVMRPVETSTPVPGCNFQPAMVSDKVSDTEFAEATHKCISPCTGPNTAANAAVLAVQAEDTLTFGGVDHRVVGKRVYRDWYGRLDHVTVYAQEQHSG